MASHPRSSNRHRHCSKNPELHTIITWLFLHITENLITQSPKMGILDATVPLLLLLLYYTLWYAIDVKQFILSQGVGGAQSL
jgi:presenilin-like A22 family membrane protease